MIKANIATAKNDLSRLLRRVKKGERVIITERNQPIAQLQPLTNNPSDPTNTSLAPLFEAGVLTPPLGARLNVAAFLAMPGATLSAQQSLTAAVLAEREEGR